MARDYYDVLGVSRNAGAEEIQQAFRKLARKHHPDVNKDPDAEERFKEINDAYSVLSDPGQRQRYDRFGENFRQIPEDYDERVAAAAGARSGGAAGGGHRVRFHTDHGDDFAGADIDFDDLFGGIFGRGGPGGPRGPIPGADQEAEIQLGVEDAYRGGKRSITLGGPGGQRTYDVNIPAESSTGSASGWPERAGRAVAAPRRATCSCAFASNPTAGSVWRAGTFTSWPR
uniref:J domain-containing protein n=1 Tax=Streptomyces avermitilis TaxID=33903 RepID=A0A499W666_STRAX|nr:hypothetical protein SAVMC3_86280 [Streptomyces avermitilis]